MRFRIGSAEGFCAAVSIECGRAFPWKRWSVQTEGGRVLWFTFRLALASMGVAPLPRCHDQSRLPLGHARPAWRRRLAPSLRRTEYVVLHPEGASLVSTSDVCTCHGLGLWWCRRSGPPILPWLLQQGSATKALGRCEGAALAHPRGFDPLNTLQKQGCAAMQSQSRRVVRPPGGQRVSRRRDGVSRDTGGARPAAGSREAWRSSSGDNFRKLAAWLG